MQKIIPQISTIENEAPRNVSPGQTAIIAIRPGYTRLREHLTLGGSLTLDKITDISIWKNGQILRQLGSATDLDKRNQYNGLPSYASSGVLTISHIREGLRRFVETHATGVGMATGVKDAINSLDIKLEIDGTAPASSTITSVGEVTSPRGPGIILRETVEDFEYNTNGEKVINSLIQEDEQIDCIFLEENNLTVDSLEVRNFGTQIFSRTAAVNNHIINSGGFKLPQSGLFAYDKSERGFGKEPLIVTPNGRFELRPIISGVSADAVLKVRKVSFLTLGV